MTVAAVYRTERGLLMRVHENDEGGLRVEVLREGAWVQGRIGMAGLRLSALTVRLTPAQAEVLPP